MARSPRITVTITVNDDDTFTTDVGGKRITGMKREGGCVYKGLRKHDTDVKALTEAIEAADGSIDDDAAEEFLDKCNDVGMELLRALTY